MRGLLTLFALVLSSSAGPAVARDDQALDARVVALIQAFSEARSRFDAKALDALLSPDYVEISPIGEIDRREAVLGFYAGDKARPSPPMTLSTQDVRRYTDTAIVIGSVTYVVPAPNGATVERTLRATYVERWGGGRWQMASAQFTGVQPPPPARRPDHTTP